ncbi:hypothetical protein Tco_0646790 [Tanacetum coccineum]
MAAATMKYMASNFVKLDKFKGVDFQRWQKKMHFLLSSMSMVYVLTTPIPKDGGDDATMEQIKKRAKWDNNDYNVESSKELWDPLEAKYMAEDASSKKFLVRIPKFFTMTHFKTILEKYNELLEYLEGYDKPKGNNVARALQFSIGGAITTPHRNNYTRGSCNPKLKTLGERGIECIFVIYAEHSKAFRFYIIEPNDSVSIISIIESRDTIFENRFSSVPRPSLRIPNGTEDIGGSVVTEEEQEMRSLTNTPIALMLRMAPNI